VYNEHSSFVKFIERNWKLDTKLTDRSRDNLPNPQQSDDDDDDAYVPRNMPAIGDLFDLFDFDHHRDRDHHGDGDRDRHGDGDRGGGGRDRF
jgi:phospholipase C